MKYNIPIINALFLISLFLSVSSLNIALNSQLRCNPLPEGCIVLFQHCDFKGKFLVLCNEMNDIYDHFTSNLVGSIRIGKYTKVFYWDETNYFGKMNSLSTTDTCLEKPISSIRIDFYKPDKLHKKSNSKHVGPMREILEIKKNSIEKLSIELNNYIRNSSSLVKANSNKTKYDNVHRNFSSVIF
jgi:hypothetical protein